MSCSLEEVCSGTLHGGNCIQGLIEQELGTNTKHSSRIFGTKSEQVHAAKH